MKHDADSERESLQLLSDFRDELATALNSLGGKQSRGLHDNYYVAMGGHLNGAAEGFIFLRRAGRINATKLLVRPAIEVAFRIEAVRRHPELLFRIAYSERLETRRWIRAAASRAGIAYDGREDEAQWRQFKSMYEAQCRNHEQIEKPVKISEIAAQANLSPYYDSHYRLYCQYEHAALAATSGSLQEISDSEDSREMILALLAVVNSLGAIAPNLQALRDRLKRLGRTLPV